MQSDAPEQQSEAPESQIVDRPAERAGARRRIWRSLGVLVAALVLAGVATAGYVVVTARASGGGTSLPLAPVKGLPSQSPGATQAPPRQHWTVVRAQGRSVKVFADVSTSSKVLTTVPPRTRYHVDSVMLVRSELTAAGQTWYDVLLPVPPMYSHGWVRASSVSMYFVYVMIKIDLSTRTLSVVQDDKVIDEFPVAVGAPQTPTPTGTFFVTEKVRALNPNTVYGPAALGLSAFSSALAATFPPDGQVAIHGWTDPSVIGHAISHGCIRMKIADILKLSSLVSTGSPVDIKE
jgi:lipoprotein-anchoring transpeptidase ErfK/SrfK